VGGGGTEAFGESEEDGVFAEIGRVLSEVVFDKVLEEVFLLPAIKWFIKNGLEFKVLGRAGVEELVELFEGRAVVWFTLFEGGVFETEEIEIAEIFDEGDVAADVVVKNAGDVESGGGEEFGDGEEVGIVRSFKGVVDADEAGVIIGLNADDGATGSALLDRLHEDTVGRGEIEVGADCGEQGIGRHQTKEGV